ncbi:hypothetical protein HaLaN_00181 [Haematococcus lacustris]|uniref:Uncharacterized protein n=1 Tax=Haematococcus lacustris TaxID=44745 RepID=A0A699YRC0_HAELA|nr:hypothetical protein HaLaN_00181 [Haematococcus lacustris]
MTGSLGPDPAVDRDQVAQRRDLVGVASTYPAKASGVCTKQQRRGPAVGLHQARGRATKDRARKVRKRELQALNN